MPQSLNSLKIDILPANKDSWYFTIQEFRLTFKNLSVRTIVVADSLSRNVPVVAVTQTPTMPNFSLLEWRVAQHQHDIWQNIMYALESGDELNYPSLTLPYSQFYLTPDGVLFRSWTHKREKVPQFVIPECYVPAILKYIHDGVTAGHREKERILTSARINYHWPTVSVDIDAYVEKCVKCSQIKKLPRPAPILEYSST